jgi:hypothetical protein
VALTGTYGQVTTTLCDTEAAFIEAADAMAETLYGEQCQAFLDYFYGKRWVPTSSDGLMQLRRKAVTE